MIQGSPQRQAPSVQVPHVDVTCRGCTQPARIAAKYVEGSMRLLYCVRCGGVKAFGLAA